MSVSFHSRAAAFGAAFVACAASARAQTTFSIDYRGPTKGVFAGIPITEGDILAPATFFPAPGPLPPPVILIPHGPAPIGLGLPGGPACAPPGIPCGDEVDALSYGLDGPHLPGALPGSFKFSVGRTTLGLPSPVPPNVATEAAAFDAAADVFIDLGLPPGPLPPFVALAGNTRMIDGNGAPPFANALGLIEPHGPPCAALVSPGDNVDALDVNGPLAGPIYLSLEGAGLDLCGFPRTASAMINGVPPGAILNVFGAGGPLVPYAMPPALGLDFFGPLTDDLDALAVFENGAVAFQPSPGPYAWAPMAPFDMVLFSVTGTSAVIGAPDSIFGLPIAPGDILVPPVAGGLSPFPGIFIAAENLGLATVRSGAVANDELDALDVTAVAVIDCNGNGIEDALEIALGGDCDGNGVLDVCELGGADCNANGVLDRCESSVASYCTSSTTTAGCNPTISAAGVPSASLACPFTLDVANVEGQKLGIVFYGVSGASASPWGSGFLCVKAPTQRTGSQFSAGAVGACNGAFTLDFNLYMATHPLALGQPLFAGELFFAQAWFRDPPAPKTTNMSNALRFQLAP